MNVHIDFVTADLMGRVVGSDDLPTHVWNRVRESVLAFEPEAHVVGRLIEVDWRTVLNAASELARLRERYGFATTYNDSAREQLVRYRDEARTIRSAHGTQRLALSERELGDRLTSLGFTRRDLK